MQIIQSTTMPDVPTPDIAAALLDGKLLEHGDWGVGANWPQVDLHAPAGGVGARIGPRNLGVGGRIRPRFVRGGVGIPVQKVPAGQMEQPVQYEPDEYDFAEVSYMGFGRLTVTPGGTRQTFKILPDRPIVPQKFAWRSNVQNLLLHQIIIAGTNMLANEDGVPIEILSEVSRLPQIQMATIQTSTGISMTFSNFNAGDAILSGGVYGTLLGSS